MRGKFNGFFIVKQIQTALTVLCSIVKFFRKRLEHSRSMKTHSTTSRPFPYTSCYPAHSYVSPTMYAMVAIQEKLTNVKAEICVTWSCLFVWFRCFS